MFCESELGCLESILEFALGVGILLFISVSESSIGDLLPTVTSIDFVQSDDERRFSLLQQTNGFKSLRFETVLHCKQTVNFRKNRSDQMTYRDIDDQDGDVTQRTTSGS